MDREYFTFMASFHRAAKALKDPAERLAFYEAIADYALSGEKQEDCSELVRAMLELVYPVLERQRTNSLNRKKDVLKNEDSEEKDVLKNEDCEKNETKTKTERNQKENETKSKRNQNENETTPSLRIMDKDKDMDMDREKEKEKEKEMSGKPDTRTRFKAPSVDEVRAYAAENGYNLDADRFVDYYTSNGWKVGRNPMKDWRAAVRNWCKGDKGGGTAAVKGNKDPTVIELTESQKAMMNEFMAKWEAEEKQELKQG